MVSTFPQTNSLDFSQIRLEIKALHSQLVQWRRHLHQYPELGFQEKLTAKFVAQKLQEWAIDHQTDIAKTGIVATINSSYPGPV
ncbi:MAG: amidohydrolase, partial [Spirulinaceae cyanobacterium]